MSILQLRGDYLNDYERARDVLSNKKGLFYEEDWEAMVRRGQDDLDMWIGALSSPDVTYEKLNQVYDNKFDYLDSENRRMAILNEVRENKNELAKDAKIYKKDDKGNYIYNELTGEPEMEKVPEMTEYDYTKYIIQQNAEYNKRQRDLELAEQAKSEMNKFLKIGATIAATGGELASDFMKQVDSVMSLIGASVASGIALFDPNKTMIDAFVETLGDDSIKLWKQIGFEEALFDFERQYTGIRDIEGNFTYGGKILAGMANSIGQMLPSMLICQIPTIGAVPGAGSAIFYSGVTASNISEMYKKFETKEGLSVSAFNILSNAVIKSTLQLGVELVLPKILGFGPSGLDSMMFGRTAQSIVGKSLTNAGVKRVMQDFLEEGLEEVLQDTTDYLTDQFYYLFTKKDYGSLSEYSFQNLVDSFVIGGLTSFVGNASKIVFTARKQLPELNKNETDLKKLNKIASWEFGLDFKSFIENSNLVLNTLKDADYSKIQNNSQMLNKIKTAMIEVYASYRMISSLYAEIGDERVTKANELLQKAGQVNILTEDIGTQIKEAIDNSKEVYQQVYIDKVSKLKDECKKAGINKIKKIVNKSNITKINEKEEIVNKLCNILGITPEEAKKEISNKQETKELTDNKVEEGKINQIDNVIISEDGTDIGIGMDKNTKKCTIFASEDYINIEDVEKIFQRYGEKTLVQTVRDGSFKKSTLETLNKLYNECKNGEYSVEDAINGILFDANVFNEILQKSDKDMEQFVEYIVKLLSKTSSNTKLDLIYREVINKRISLLKMYLRDYYINTPLAIINNTIFTKEEIKTIESVRPPMVQLLAIKNKLKTIDKYELSNKEIGILFNTFKTYNISQENINSINKAISKHDNTTILKIIDNNLTSIIKNANNRYKGKYNNEQRFIPYTSAQIKFNLWLDSLGFENIKDIFNIDLLTSEDKNTIIDFYGDINIKYIEYYRNEQFKNFTDDVYSMYVNDILDFESLKTNNIILDTNYENINYGLNETKEFTKKLKENAKYNAEALVKARLNGETLILKDIGNTNRGTSLQSIEKEVNEIYRFLNITEDEKLYYNLNDIISNHNLLNKNTLEEIKNKYGVKNELTGETIITDEMVYLYLRDNLRGNNIDILKTELGDYLFVNIAPSNAIFRDDINTKLINAINYSKIKPYKTKISEFFNIDKIKLESNIDITFIYDDNPGENGHYSPATDEIVIYYNLAKTYQSIKKTLIHELQHKFQMDNNLINGSDPDVIYDVFMKNPKKFMQFEDDLISRNLINKDFNGMRILSHFVYQGTGETNAFQTAFPIYSSCLFNVELRNKNLSIIAPWGKIYTFPTGDIKLINSEYNYTLGITQEANEDEFGKQFFEDLGFDTNNINIEKLYNQNINLANKTNDNINKSEKSKQYIVSKMPKSLLKFIGSGNMNIDEESKQNIVNDITDEYKNNSLEYLYNEYYSHIKTFEEFLKTDIPIITYSNNENPEQSVFTTIKILTDYDTAYNTKYKAVDIDTNYSIIGYIKPNQLITAYISNNENLALVNPKYLYNTNTWNDNLSDNKNTNINDTISFYSYNITEKSNIGQEADIKEEMFTEYPELKNITIASIKKSLKNNDKLFNDYFNNYLKSNKQFAKEYNSKNDVIKEVLKEKVKNNFDNEIDNSSELKLYNDYVKYELNKKKVKKESKFKKTEKVNIKEKYPNKMLDANKQIQLSFKKYGDTNLTKYGYMKKGYRNELDAGTVSFIVNATDKIDKELWNKVKSGKISKKDIINHFLTKDINQATFDLINKSYFQNEDIKNIKQLNDLVELSKFDYALNLILRKFDFADKALDNTDPIIKEQLIKLFSEDAEYKDAWDKITAYFDDKVLSKENYKLYTKYNFMKYYDTSLGSAGKASWLAAFVAQQYFKTQFDITNGKITEDNILDTIDEALASELNELSYSEKIDVLNAKKAEELKNKIDEIGYEKVKEELLQYSKDLQKMSEEDLDKEYLKVVLKQDASYSDIDVDNKVDEAIDDYVNDNNPWKIVNKAKMQFNKILKSRYFYTKSGQKSSTRINNFMNDKVTIDGTTYEAKDLFEIKNLTTKEERERKTKEDRYSVIRIKDNLFKKPGRVTYKQGKDVTRGDTIYKTPQEIEGAAQAIIEFAKRIYDDAYRREDFLNKYLDEQIALEKQKQEDTAKLFKKLEDLGKTQNQKAKSLKNIVVINTINDNITTENNKKLPSALKRILEQDFTGVGKTKVKYLSNDTDYHTKVNFKTFIEANADILAELTQTDINELIEFFQNTDIFIPNIDQRKYLFTKAFLMEYLIDGSGISNFILDSNQLEYVKNYLQEWYSMFGQGLAWRKQFLDEFHPQEILQKALAKQANIELSDEDADLLVEAMMSGNMDKLNAVKGEIVERLQKQYPITQRSAWDKLLEWQRMAMLSGPGTWARNVVSNVLVSGGNKLAESMFSLINKIFPKTEKHIEGQYKIVGTKVTNEIKQYITNNVINNGLYDIIADGITKYDVDKLDKKKATGNEVLIDIIASSISKEINANLPNSKNLQKVQKAIMTMMSDNWAVKKSFISYLGKILTEEIENGHITQIELESQYLTNKIQKYIAEAYTMAAHDYMHKRNFINDVEAMFKNKFGDAAFFAYKQIFPFASSAWNWFEEAIKYTPVGLFKAVKNFIHLEDAIGKKQAKLESNKKLDAIFKNTFNIKFTEYDIKRNIGKGIIGSIGMIIGGLLAACGLAALDDKDDNKPKLKIGDMYIDIKDLFGTSGLIMGATIISVFKDKNSEQSWFTKFTDALGTTFSNVFIDDSVVSLYSTLRYFVSGDTRALIYYPYNTITKFIPNFMRTLSGITKGTETIYSSNIFIKYLQKYAETIPGLSWLMDYNYDIYTGEYQTTYDNWFLTNFVNKLLPINFEPYSMSDTEKLAFSLGVKKGNLTGKYTINGEDANLKTNDIAKLNMLYGKLNKSELDKLTNNKQKYKVYDEKSNSYKELYFKNMTDKEKAAAIKQVMSKNSDYSKIYILTSTGKYKYYASDTEYSELRKLGITSNVYRKTNNKEGFVKN